MRCSKGSLHVDVWMCGCVWQVDVFIPGHHTHGSIVVRRAWDKQGMEVIEHLVEKVGQQTRGFLWKLD